MTGTVRGTNTSGTWELSTGERGTWTMHPRCTLSACPADVRAALWLLVERHTWDWENANGFGLMGVRP